MFQKEVTEMIQDIHDAFEELGTLDNKVNLIWKKRLINSPDRTTLHEKYYSKLWRDYEMKGLALGTASKEEILNEGLSDEKVFKFYIDAGEFIKYNTTTFTFEPQNADRVLHRGVLYEVVKRKPIHISNEPILYLVFGTEAAIPVQSEEYREKEDPIFEYDASQEETSTNTTGGNKNLFIDLPIRVKCNAELPFVVWSTDNKFAYKTETMEDKLVYSIPTGNYDLVKLINTFKPTGLKLVSVIEDNEEVLYLETDSIGVNAKLEIFIQDEAIYDLLGVEIGIYQGTEVLNI